MKTIILFWAITLNGIGPYETISEEFETWSACYERMARHFGPAGCVEVFKTWEWRKLK